MYLSRVEVDVNNRRKIRDLTHLGAYHSWVEDSFPEEERNETRTRKLWRLDRLQEHLYLLIVSVEKPDLERLEKYGIEGSAETRDYDPFLSRIRNGNRYLFKAALNPVHSVHSDSGKRGRVYPEITAEQQMGYLERRSEANGFSLVPDSYWITERKYEVLKKKDQRPVRLSKVTFEGKLVVTDAEGFRIALISGIGKKKAYGFGMMTVIPEEN